MLPRRSGVHSEEQTAPNLPLHTQASHTPRPLCCEGTRGSEVLLPLLRVAPPSSRCCPCPSLPLLLFFPSPRPLLWFRRPFVLSPFPPFPLPPPRFHFLRLFHFLLSYVAGHARWDSPARRVPEDDDWLVRWAELRDPKFANSYFRHGRGWINRLERGGTSLKSGSGGRNESWLRLGG